MKNLIRSFIIIFWFFVQRDRFDKIEWLIQIGYPLIDAFYLVYNGYC